MRRLVVFRVIGNRYLFACRPFQFVAGHQIFLQPLFCGIQRLRQNAGYRYFILTGASNNIGLLCFGFSAVRCETAGKPKISFPANHLKYWPIA